MMEQEKHYREELFKLMQENPELPVVPMVDYEIIGEDFSICVGVENLPAEVREYAAGFDIDEHIEMWILAKRSGTGGVPSTRELVKDAEDIDKMLQEIAAALSRAEEASECDT